MSDSEISGEFFQLVLESAPDAMVIVDDKGRIAIVNEQAEKMFGYTRDDLLGEAIELLVPTQAKRRHHAHVKNFLKSPRSRMMGIGQTLYGRRRDGSEFPAEVSLSPVSTRDGLYVSSAIRDVTEHKKMEQDIVAARHEAERANKANTAFLAAASHDLRQPVQALSLLNGALMRTVSDSKALEMVSAQAQSITAMTNLLNSLLDISRLDAGAIMPDFEEFPIRLVIDRLGAEFSRQAQQKALTFSAESCDAVVRSDVNLLSEIVQNLVSNGIRYTEKGGVELVCITTETECRLSVVDTGIGIEADQLDKVFNEFYQCNASSSNKEGFGLGLAIVSRLADLLDHAVEVTSTPKVGSSFTVVIPLIAKDTQQIPTSSTSKLEKAPSFDGCVLLVEDDPQVSAALKLLFESAGYAVALAKSEVEALATLTDDQMTPDLIVSDYHLVGPATGVETIISVRKLLGRDVPAFILSGDTSELIDEAKKITNCQLISKPCDPEHLLSEAVAVITTERMSSSSTLA